MNLYRQVVLHHFNFKQRVYDIKYSPDGRYRINCVAISLAEPDSVGSARLCRYALSRMREILKSSALHLEVPC